jgi:hypothetical protein
MRRSLCSSADLRDAAVIGGCDCWPLIEDELAGIALLQFPWSARAMDEAGAAFDALQPAAALTYAEAGGWGRALALEARRRRIPFAGLQHGFIYRHWLNYLHEPDEMRPAAPGSTDLGFPLPTVTLAFDEYAARHLVQKAAFPPWTVAVTGSPRLDGLVTRFRALDALEIARARHSTGGEAAAPVVLLVTKYSEVQPALTRLLEVFGEIPEVQLAIKTHPAETPAGYLKAASAMINVRVLPAGADLAPLLRVASALITVNSTVALDAMVLGVPALSIGQPNNLTPFVAMGAIAGADSSTDLERSVKHLVYDQEFRHRLLTRASAVVAEYRMMPDGQAAERCASAILALAGEGGRGAPE